MIDDKVANSMQYFATHIFIQIFINNVHTTTYNPFAMLQRYKHIFIVGTLHVIVEQWINKT